MAVATTRAGVASVAVIMGSATIQMVVTVAAVEEATMARKTGEAEFALVVTKSARVM